jgi:hypothetical protein
MQRLPEVDFGLLAGSLGHDVSRDRAGVIADLDLEWQVGGGRMPSHPMHLAN